MQDIDWLATSCFLDDSLELSASSREITLTAQSLHMEQLFFQVLSTVASFFPVLKPPCQSKNAWLPKSMNQGNCVQECFSLVCTAMATAGSHKLMLGNANQPIRNISSSTSITTPPLQC